MRFKLINQWYQRHLTPLTVLLLPFSWLFGLITTLRRMLYEHGILKTQYFPSPVLVVGNITFGGTGKTPFIIWAANWLQRQGYRPGIVSRGVGGLSHLNPHRVASTDTAKVVGDEALLMARHANCPLMICRDRAAAVQELLKQSDCNIILSDDGLQHYRMGRQIEIVLVDGARRFGNQQLLPAGPLREPITRLQKADFVVINDGDVIDEYEMKMVPSGFVAVNQKNTLSFNEFPRQRVHAVAGIGHPERFFQLLSQAGFEVIPHYFPDHYQYQAQDIDFNDDVPVIMTEKDAVKCTGFAKDHYWYMTITVKIDEALQAKLLTAIAKNTVKLGDMEVV